MFLSLIPRLATSLLALAGSLPAVSASPAHSPKHDKTPRNLATVEAIYNLTLYPNYLVIFEQGDAGIPAGLFNEDARGRIGNLGNFTGFNDSVEYFFALPAGLGNSSAFYKADIVSYSSDCDEVAATVAYLYTGEVNRTTGEFIGDEYTILVQVAFWRFDPDGAVLEYSAWIPTLEKWIEAVSGVATTDQERSAAIEQLCQGIQQRCTGSNQQYQDVAQCTSVLGGKEFGSWDEVWGDNVVCRIVHVILTLIRPEVHCPHVGPIGGSGPDNYKCTPIDYRTVYFNDVELFGGDGRPFNCPSKQGH